MRLADPSLVLIATGIASNAGSLDGAGRALDSISPIIESLLETEFKSSSFTDYFTTDGKAKAFRLSRMFVDADSTITVRVATQEFPILFTPTDGAVAEEGVDYIIEAEKGIITFRDAPAEGAHSLSVSYDAGFGDDGVTYSNVPYWLSEAAVACAVVALNSLPFNQANRKEKSVTNAAKAVSAFAYSLLSGKFRPRMSVEFPARTTDHG